VFFSLSYKRRLGVSTNRRCPMPMIDPPAVLALASLVSSLATLVWSMRRKA